MYKTDVPNASRRADAGKGKSMKERLDAARGAIEGLIGRAIAENRHTLYEHEVYDVLRAAGFRVPATLFVRRREEIESLPLDGVPGSDVVCKLISPGMPHRTEHGGIRFERRERNALTSAFDRFAGIAEEAKVPFAGMMIAELIPGKDCIPFQLLISLRQDAAFGPVVFCGLGGVGTELYQKSLLPERGLFMRAAPLVRDRAATEKELRETLFYPMLIGETRVSDVPLAEGAAIVASLETFAWLAGHFSHCSQATRYTIEELEVNPLQVTPGGELVPLDALMRVSDEKQRETNPPGELIQRLLAPRSALVIGASAGKLNTGRIILRNLIKGGGVPRERIYCLHPEAREIDGCRAVADIAALPEKTDMTVFTVPADEKAEALLEKLIDGGNTSSITVISAGFGETEGGRVLEERLRASIRSARARPDGGVAVNGPNCMGIVSKPGGYNTFFIPEHKLPFGGEYGERSAVISQSGAYLVTLVSNIGRIFNPKYMITFGNQIDITATDYLLALKDDADIDLFVIYIEGFRPYDGERFLAAAREAVRNGKSIILYKAGRTDAGAAAVASHTASMAGDFAVMRRLLTDSGVILLDNLDAVEDAIKVFVLIGRRNARGRRVGIFSNAGFECSVAADALDSLTLASFSGETARKLRESLPADIIDVHNPVDATPITNAVNYGRCLEAMLADDGVDCLVAANVAPTPFMENLTAGEGHSEDILHENSYPNVTIRVFRGTAKPMVACLNSGPLYDPAVRMIEDAGIPCFRKIDRATRALGLFMASRTSPRSAGRE
jgi:acyl-CoA synthetase (NDP forming)